MFKDIRTDRSKKRRLAFAEGQDRRVLRAVQSILEANFAVPILVGDENAIHAVVEQEGLTYSLVKDVQIVPSEDGNHFRDQYLRETLLSDHGWDPRHRSLLHRGSKNTPIAARLVTEGSADCVVCGVAGRSIWHFLQLADILGVNVCRPPATLHAIIRDNRWLFLGSPSSGLKSLTEVATLVVAARTYLNDLQLNSNIWICTGEGDEEDACYFNRLLMQTTSMLEANISGTGIVGPISLSDILGGRLWTGDRQGNCDLVIFRSSRLETLARVKLGDVAGTMSVGPIETTFHNKAHVVSASFGERELLTVAAFAATGADCLSVLDTLNRLKATGAYM